MKVTIHQPAFLPWAGFWAKVLQSDALILVENWQFSNSSFEHRVKVGGSFLTMPVHSIARNGQTVSPAKLLVTPTAKQVRTFEQAYLSKKSKHKDAISFILEPFMEAVGKETILAEINTDMMLRTAELFGFHNVLHVKEHRYYQLLSDDKTEHLTNLLEAYTPDYTRYNSGAGGRNYLDSSKFRDVKFQSLPTDMSQDSILSWISQFGVQSTIHQLKNLGEWHDK